MKKRMFLSTILMTLVLLVALTTATFAWYQATSSNAAGAADQLTVDTVANQFSTGSAILTVTPHTTDKVVGPTNTSGQIKYWSGTVLVDGADTAYAKYGEITFTMSIQDAADTGLTGDALWASAAGTYTVTVSISDNARLSATLSGDASQYVGAGATTLTFDVTINPNGSYTLNNVLYYAVNESVKDAGTDIVISTSLAVKQ